METLGDYCLAESVNWLVCTKFGERRVEWQSELTVTTWVKVVLKMLRNDLLSNCIVILNKKILISTNLFLLLSVLVRSYSSSVEWKASLWIYEFRVLYNRRQHSKILVVLDGHKWWQSTGLKEQIKICCSRKIVSFSYNIWHSCICHDIMTLLREKKWKIRSQHSCYLNLS